MVSAETIRGNVVAKINAKLRVLSTVGMRRRCIRIDDFSICRPAFQRRAGFDFNFTFPIELECSWPDQEIPVPPGTAAARDMAGQTLPCLSAEASHICCVYIR